MKHAYLIMAHGNFEQLQFLVHLLDCGQNDIFIHIDKKTEICDLSLKTKYSAVTIFQKYKIYWGTYSQVECELFLQTLLCDSPYRSRLYEGVYSNLRFVKFSEDNRSSHPYLIDRSLLEIAQKSGCLFARKFDFDRFPDVKKSINEMFNGEL